MRKLIYLTIIRSDIPFAVSQISRFMHTPRISHLDVLNRILQYLKGTLEKRIWISKNNINVMCGYSDIDWA
jgi:hypothetical protein